MRQLLFYKGQVHIRYTVKSVAMYCYSLIKQIIQQTISIYTEGFKTSQDSSIYSTSDSEESQIVHDSESECSLSGGGMSCAGGSWSVWSSWAGCSRPGSWIPCCLALKSRIIR